jgi:hypothetical protein
MVFLLRRKGPSKKYIDERSVVHMGYSPKRSVKALLHLLSPPKQRGITYFGYLLWVAA